MLIACGSIRPELEALRADEQELTVRYMPQALHRSPERLNRELQEALAEVPDQTLAVLGYGLCANGVVGLQAPAGGLVIPRVHDCVALLLGSGAAYEQAFRVRPGTYYLTQGWIEARKDPLGMLEDDYIPRVGEKDAIWALHEEFKHYTHLALIQTPAGVPAALRQRARKNASYLRKEYLEVHGGAHFFERILRGPYEPPDFLRLAPGETVTQEPFLE
jgi:hypothetical protein